MNTFLLENRRRIQSGDCEALNIVVVRLFGRLNAMSSDERKLLFEIFQDQKRGVTTIKHLLMADTRDERLNWCKVLNSALENMRAWDPTSMRARSGSESTTTSVENEDTISSASTDIW